MKVLLAIPCNESIHWRLVPWIVKICKEAELYISSMIGNEANRNAITEYFLAGDWDYLLMIDTDQEPLDNPLRMIKHDKDVIVAPTLINMGSLVWNVFDKSDDPEYAVSFRNERKKGLEKVFAVGTGCILIKRKVLETIKNPFVPKRGDDDRRIVTQDVVFSEKCREAGFELWVDWDTITRHYKTIDLLSI